MSAEAAPSQPTLLERIDLALAQRLVATSEEHRLLAVAEDAGARVYRPSPRDSLWIAGLLRLRGLDVTEQDVDRVHSGNAGRFNREQQEYLLIEGGRRLLDMLRDGAAKKIPAEGFYIVELFKTLTSNVSRFRNNSVRQDAPWDGLIHGVYPAPEDLDFILGSFDFAHRFRDMPVRFDALHPVRQSFRIFWRLAKISPFPDLNLPMAWVAMCSWLLAHGYPAIPARQEDKALAERMLGGAPPLRVGAWEHRILDEVCHLRGD